MSSRVGLISIFFVFLLVLIIQLLTPFHSDDFGFYLKGYSFETLYHVYMTWSGRLFSDFTGSLVMSIKDKTIISLINACAFTSLILLLTKLPSENKNNWLVFVLLFMLYWIDNPSLSQTSFWVVGSANYLWTNLFVYSWLFLLIRNTHTKSYLMISILIAMAIISGMTTENLGTTIFGVLVLYITYEFYKNKTLHWLVIAQLFFLCIGISILLLAPGNYIRASVCCEAFYSTPLIERILNHFPMQFIREMYEYKYTLLILALTLGYGIYKKKDLSLSLFLLMGSLASNAILFATPQTTGRVLNTGLVLALASLSFAINAIIDKKPVKYAYIAITLMVAIPFSQSYVNNYSNLKSVFAQDQIRTIMIKDGYSEVPIYYQGDVKKESDKLDIFFNEEAIGKFYGANGKIKLIDMPFDYSLITPRNIKINDDTFLNFRRLNDIFVFEVSNKIENYKGMGLFFRLKMDDGEEINADFVPVLRNYKGMKLINSYKIDLHGKKIKSFTIGFYDYKKGINTKSITEEL